MIAALRSRAIERPLVSSFERLLEYLRFAQGFDFLEPVRVLYLAAGKRVLTESLLTRSSPDRATIEPRVLFGQAIQAGAASFILVHNHPSGDPTPSEADKRMTRQLDATGQALGIRLTDHIIIATNRAFSFRAAGLI